MSDVEQTVAPNPALDSSPAPAPAPTSPAPKSPAPARTAAPAADRRPTERTHHGDVVVDDYEWLRAKDDPDVVAHLEAENAWTEQELGHLAPLREQIFGEIKARTLETDLSVPVRQGGHWYFTRTTEGDQYGVHARVAVGAGGGDDRTPPAIEPGVALPGEQVLLDENAEAEGHDFFSLGATDVTPDGRLLAYAVDTAGDERYTLRVRDLTTGEDLPDVVENTFPGAVFEPRGRYLFYPTVDEAWRPYRVWRHEIGTPASEDVLVFEEPDERFWVGVGLSRSQRYLQIELGSQVTSESWLLEADDPVGEFRVVWPRRDGVEYGVEHVRLPDVGDALLVLHNDGAQNFELAVTGVPPRPGEDAAGAPLPPSTDSASAAVVLPHDPATRLEGVEAFAGHVVVSYRRDAISRLGLVPLMDVVTGRHAPYEPGGEAWPVHEIGFDEPLYSVGLGSNPEFDQPLLRLGYTSFVTPSTVYDYDLATGELLLRKRQPVLGGYDPADYVQRREWATADDGTLVPISLVWRRDRVTLDSAGTGADPVPVWLHGYGAYEISSDPAFSVLRLPVLDRGVVLAVAHVRGGGEMGRRWYDDGKLLRKRNTFTDFVACARHLVGTGWTVPQKIVAEGRSAGGLLVGAAVNLAPDMFAGVLAGVPFVDALTSILDPSLPLTVVEWDEWGNPLEDPEVYRYMRSYSPYENVDDDASRYPRILAVTSFNDTRVLYVEPAKWVARLRAAGAPALLKIDMAAGHGGVSGRYARWKDVAFERAWMLDVLGLA